MYIYFIMSIITIFVIIIFYHPSAVKIAKAKNKKRKSKVRMGKGLVLHQQKKLLYDQYQMGINSL